MTIDIPKAAMQLIDELYAAGGSAYIVGGCVRDILLGQTPHDYDICTSASPGEMLDIFRDYRVIPTGLRHGTVTVMLSGEPYEITTFRIDGEYTDNRRPDSVRFTSDIDSDLARRDFTMNAIAYSPYDGLKDPFGGIEDIRAGIIRSVGNAEDRFKEDALRIIRAWRFSCRLGFAVESDTAEASYKYIGLLKNVSAERVNSELIKMAEYPQGLSDLIRKHPKLLSAVIRTDKEPRNAALIAGCSDFDLSVRLAVLLHCCFGFSGCEAELKMRELKFDGHTTKNTCELIENVNAYLTPNLPCIRRSVGRMGNEQLERLVCFKQISDNEFNGAGIIELMDRIKRDGLCCRVSELDISGNDIVSTGVKGRMVGVMLNRLLDDVIDGRIGNSRTELINAVREMTGV